MAGAALSVEAEVKQTFTYRQGGVCPDIEYPKQSWIVGVLKEITALLMVAVYLIIGIVIAVELVYGTKGLLYAIHVLTSIFEG
jgi:hypothetical protein